LEEERAEPEEAPLKVLRLFKVELQEVVVEVIMDILATDK
jgi:hypothetical protein